MNRHIIAQYSPAHCRTILQLCVLSLSLHFSLSTSLTTAYYWTINDESYETQGKILNGHVFTRLSSKFLITQCAMSCLKNSGCKSFNYAKANKTCELNDATHDEYPDDVKDSGDYEYHTREAFTIDKDALGPCFSMKCHNKGTCIEEISGDQMVAACSCTKGFTGVDCQMQDNSAGWSVWEFWSTCSETCGTGYHRRTRNCMSLGTNERISIYNCPGSDNEVEKCDGGACPKWEVWQEWGECSTDSSCGTGFKTRIRTCSNGGTPGVDKFCMGASNETRHCNGINCRGLVMLVDGEEFGTGRVEVLNDKTKEWGLICGGVWNMVPAEILCRQMGFAGASEALTANEFGGGNGQFAISQLGCSENGKNSDSLLQCEHNKWSLTETCAGGAMAAGVKCKVNGIWSLWTNWGDCSVTCEKGVQKRTRLCDYPPPSNGGLNCPGESSELKDCELATCPGNGVWLQWGNWSTCDKTCGGGLEIRTRQCENPDVMCTGDSEESHPCNEQSCPVDGLWKQWEVWSPCSPSCGNGMQFRERTCQEPEFGGSDCTGSSYQEQTCKEKECPVDGVWNPWTAWGQCSVTCGDGTKSRDRTCSEILHGGKDCEGSAVDIASCMPRYCPVDGQWEGWSDWSLCTLSCGGGDQTRQRDCHGQEHDGADCPGTNSETQNCNEHPCPIDGIWMTWMDWSSCTVSCGGGIQGRTRFCDGPHHEGEPCLGKSTEDQECNTHNCPVDGEWEGWLSWVECDVTCGGGTQTRERTCHYGEFGGKNCTGENSETQSCNEHNCPVDGKWEEWSDWSMCTLTCGNGTQSRNRICIEPLHGGAECSGTNSEDQLCNTFNCPVDGEWKTWGNWSTCSLSCGGGKQSRARECEEPQYGGAPCEGSADEEQSCNELECPVDGYWLEWTAWSTCTLDCGNGTQDRSRMCVDAKHGGKECEGENFQSQLCNTHFCPVDGVLSSWTEWGDCSLSCGNGTMSRSRSCDPPQHGGADCNGDLEENTDCFLKHCPVDANVTEWQEWSTCTLTCGGGSRARERTCEGQLYGGKYCSEHLTENEDCNIHPCPVDGKFSSWTTWGDCSVSCGGGLTLRTRNCSEVKHGGKDCDGDLIESAPCNTQNCPIDCKWLDWGEWNECSDTCGGGNQTHFRNTSGPLYGGAECEGPSEESQACNEQPCPVDEPKWSACDVTCGEGKQTRNCLSKWFCFNRTRSCNTQKCPENCQWKDWSPWGECSETCGGAGEQLRYREEISAQYGGKECEGLPDESQTCNDFPCPVNGVWDNWSDWDTCTVTCGGGEQSHSRTCIGPFHNGTPCDGPDTETQKCNEQECPVDGEFMPWTDWDTCTLTCGTGTQQRSRTCDGPFHGGNDCVGEFNQTQDCNTQNCPVDGHWSEWSEYGECNVTCGGGTKTKNRTCIGPFFDGAPCDGDSLYSTNCNDELCQIAGDWFEWSKWGLCSVTCGGGIRSRNRTCDMESYGNLTSACLGDETETEECHTYDCLPLQPHCTGLVAVGLMDSVHCEIDPDGDGPVSAFEILCDVEDEGGIGVTVFEHDQPPNKKIEGWEGAGSYQMDINYSNIQKMAQITSVIDLSESCEQFLEWKCKQAVIHNTMGQDSTWTTFWWTRNFEPADYFPGAAPGSLKCACGMDDTCAQTKPDKHFVCNCDNNDAVLRSDSGFVTKKDDLPITKFLAGDTGLEPDEAGYVTIGPVKCHGKAMR